MERGDSTPLLCSGETQLAPLGSQHRRTWSQSRGGTPSVDQRGCSVRKREGFGVTSSAAFQYLKGAAREMERGFFTGASGDRTQGNGCKLKENGLRLDNRKKKNKNQWG